MASGALVIRQSYLNMIFFKKNIAFLLRLGATKFRELILIFFCGFQKRQKFLNGLINIGKVR